MPFSLPAGAYLRTLYSATRACLPFLPTFVCMGVQPFPYCTPHFTCLRYRGHFLCPYIPTRLFELPQRQAGGCSAASGFRAPPILPHLI